MQILYNHQNQIFWSGLFGLVVSEKTILIYWGMRRYSK